MNLAVYRRFVTLNNNSKIMLRPQTKDDLEHLRQLFANAQQEDLLFLKHDVQDGDLLKHWCEHIDLARVLPVLAFHGERIVGSGSLHFGAANHRHAAQVRLFIRPEYRGLGLGTLMVREFLDVCLKLGLKIVWAEVVIDQSKVIKAFLDLGFSLNAVLPNWFMNKAGKSFDVAIMLYNLEKSRQPSF